MARHSLESFSKGKQKSPFIIGKADTLSELQTRSANRHGSDSIMVDLAARIREEHSLFVAFLQTLHERDAGEYVMAAVLLQEAVFHLQAVGKLLLSARLKFAGEEDWQQWLRSQCLLDHFLASHYMDLVQRY